MMRIPAALSLLLLALALPFTLAAPGHAATWVGNGVFNISAVNRNTANTTSSSSGPQRAKALQTADGSTTLSLDYWNASPAADATFLTHYFEASGFKPRNTTYTETNNGYIGAKFRVRLSYFIYNATATPFDANNHLRISYLYAGAQKSPDADLTLRPDSSAAVTFATADAANHQIQYVVLPDEVKQYCQSWSDLESYRVRFAWHHAANLCAFTGNPSKVYLDQLLVEVIPKLDMHYSTTGMAIGGTTYTEGTAKVPIGKIKMRRGANDSVRISGLKVTLEGGGLAAADVAALHLAVDSNNTGIYESTDTVRDTVNAPGSLTDITFSGAGLAGTAINQGQIWFVLADIAENACQTSSPKYIGIHIADQNKVTLADPLDQVATNADRGGSGVSDTLVAGDFWPIRTGTTDAARVQLIKKANITTTVTLPPDNAPISVAMGENFTVRVAMTNAAGCGTAANAQFNPPFKQNDIYLEPQFTLLGTPLPITIAAGVTETQDLLCQATVTGTLEVYGNAAFQDQSNGKTYYSADSSPSARIDITPVDIPILQITSITLSPAIGPDTSPLTLSVSVKNAGTVDALDTGLYHPATNTLFSFNITGNAGGTMDYGTPAQQTIAVGATYTWDFTWNPTPGTSGTVAVDLYAACSNGTLKPAKKSNAAEIVRPGALTVNAGEFTVSPAVSTGYLGTFVLTLRVRNTGGATVNNVVPAMPLIVDNASDPRIPAPLPTHRDGPSPASASIAGGSYTDFSWTFNSNCGTEQGYIDISDGYATGVDSVFGTTLNTGTTREILSYLIDTSISPRFFVNPAAVKVPINYSYFGNGVPRYYALDEGGTLHAYDLSANEVWAVNLPSLTGAPTANSSHLLSIWVESWNEQLVVFVGTTSATGRVYAFLDDGSSPQPFWGASLGTSYYQLPTLANVHGVVVYTDPLSLEPSLCVTAGSAFYRIDMASGIKLWSTTVMNLDESAAVVAKCVPAVDNGFVYLGGEDGRIRTYRWSNVDGAGADLITITQIGGASGRVGQITSPAIVSNRIFATNAKGLACAVASSTQLTGVSELAVAGSTVPLSEVWVSLDGVTMWTTRLGLPGAGMNLIHKITLGTPLTEAAGWAGGKDCTTAAGYQDYVSPPIEYQGYLYFSSYCSSNADPTPASLRLRSLVWVANASDGSPLSGWPYPCTTSGAGYQFQTPASLDPWYQNFILGSNDTKTYLFTTP